MAYLRRLDLPAHAGAANGVHRTLGVRASFWVSAAVVAQTLWTSAAPALVYRLYAEQWHLSHATTAAIFAVYPVTVVSVLTLFGDLSDHVGRRAAMLLGLAASMFGAAVLALAPDVIWLFAGRILMGIGVGLAAGPATAALVEFNPANRPEMAKATAAAAQAFGFAAALLVGGALVNYGPLPTRSPFLVLIAVLCPVFAAAWFLPRPSARPATRQWRVRAPHIPAIVRSRFALSAVAIMTAYTHGALILSLGGQMAHDLIGSQQAMTNGAALALFAIASGIVGVAAKPLPTRLHLLSGAAASIIGMAALKAAVAQHHLMPFLAATTISGVGYSLLFLGSLGCINEITPFEYLGGVFSALYLLAYLSMGSIAFLLGCVATTWSLDWAVKSGAVVIDVLNVATMLLAIPWKRRVRRVDPIADG